MMFTVCCGEQYKQLSKITLPSFIDYARKINSDFECITGQTSNRWEAISLKYKALDYLEQYDRILFVDLDSYISPFAPNIFEEHPDDKFYVRKLPREHHFNINSGVFIASPQHKKAFETCETTLEELKSEFNSGQSMFEKMLCQQLNDAEFEVENLNKQWHMCPYDGIYEPFYIFHAHTEIRWKEQLLFTKAIESKIKI